MVVDQTYDPEVLWKFVDVDGKELSNTAPVAVTRRTLTCNYQEFKTFTQQRIGVRSAASSHTNHPPAGKNVRIARDGRAT